MLSVGMQLGGVRKETHVVSVMNEHLETDAMRNEKGNRPLLHQKRRHRLTERNHLKVEAPEGKVLLEKDVDLRAEISLGESVRSRRVLLGTLPCVSITSLNQDANMATNVNSDTMRLMESLAKNRGKDQLLC